MSAPEAAQATTPTDMADLFRRLGAFEAAGETVRGWIAGANALALLRGAHDAGILDAARTPRCVADLAAITGLAPATMADSCGALEAHGILRQEGGRYALAADFATITDPDVPATLAAQLDLQRVIARALEHLGAPGRPYTALPADDLVVLARGATVTPATSLGRAMIAANWAIYPEMAAQLEAGGCYVEFGCGIGGAVLATLRLFPRATAIGFEINAHVIAETRRVAAALGVADRLTLRHMDVRDLTEERAYDTAFWSQGFFPEESRAAALAAIFRALKPGGYLGLPGFEGGEPPATPEARSGPFGRSYTLNRLVYAHWGIPASTADELRATVEAAGFEFIRSVPFGAWAFLLVRRPPA